MTDLFSYINESADKEKKEAHVINSEAPYTVHEITMKIKNALEPAFSDIWVEGEISNYKKHSSGHHYFSLKDDKAVISCVMWRSTGDKLGFDPENGIRVTVCGSVSVYEGGGRYQIDVKKMIVSGIGDLQAKFEALKKKLYEEGLFDPSRKRKLPYYISKVGVITAETGAAFQDIIKVVRARAPYLNIYLYNARVQGKSTESEIVEGIEYFNSHKEYADVIIIGRGGGSLEDLWTFNEEVVAWAVFKSDLPVISAVGHEIDFSISDFTADVRAATPSHAAEIISINVRDELQSLDHYGSRIKNLAVSYFAYQKEIIKGIEYSHAFRMPEDIIKNNYILIDGIEDDLKGFYSDYLEAEKIRIGYYENVFRSLNPESVMNRGYAIVRDKITSKIITSSKSVGNGRKIEIIFSDGSVDSTTD
jgi:exodeoxyribonuclease VII large subunit